MVMRILAIATLATGLALAGCASGTVKQLSADSRASQERLAELTKATEDLRTELAALRTQVETMRRELEASAQAREQAQREALDEVAKRAAATDKRVDALTGAVRGVEMTVGGMADQVTRLEAVASNPGARRDGRANRAATRAAAATLAAEELFARANESFKNGELAQAILDFEDFVGRYPSHPLAGTAQFSIGEAYYNARDYQHATAEYKKAVEMTPRGEKTPEALFKLGLAHRALRRPDRAREVWSQLLRDFPQSDAAQKARLAMREVSRAGKPGPAPESR